MIRSVVFLLVSFGTWYGWTKYLGIGKAIQWSDLKDAAAVFQGMNVREELASLSAVEIGIGAVMLLVWLGIMLCAVLVPLGLVRVGTRGRGFWASVAGCLGAALFTLVWFVMFGPSLVPVGVLAALAVWYWGRVLSSALSPGFRSKEGPVEIDIDHGVVSVTAGSRVRVFPKGLVGLQQGSERQSWEETAGGPYMSTQMVHVSNSDGTYGTAHVPVTVGGQYYKVTRSRATGRSEYTLRELGPDHGLLSAAKPEGVKVIGRLGGDAKLSFALGGMERERFEHWCRFHPDLFYRVSSEPASRIKAATKAVLKELKQQRGKPRRYEITFDEHLQLEALLALYDDGIWISSQTTERRIGFHARVEDLMSCYRSGQLEIDGKSFVPGQDIRVVLDRWVQVALAKSPKA